jgi:hypothetical protein
LKPRMHERFLMRCLMKMNDLAQNNRSRMRGFALIRAPRVGGVPL